MNWHFNYTYWTRKWLQIYPNSTNPKSIRAYLFFSSLFYVFFVVVFFFLLSHFFLFFFFLARLNRLHKHISSFTWYIMHRVWKLYHFPFHTHTHTQHIQHSSTAHREQSNWNVTNAMCDNGRIETTCVRKPFEAKTNHSITCTLCSCSHSLSLPRHLSCACSTVWY